MGEWDPVSGKLQSVFCVPWGSYLSTSGISETNKKPVQPLIILLDNIPLNFLFIITEEVFLS